MLNAYYVMNDIEIPKPYMDYNKVSSKSFKEYTEIHQRKKDSKERKYRGYFVKEDGTKNRLLF